MRRGWWIIITGLSLSVSVVWYLTINSGYDTSFQSLGAQDECKSAPGFINKFRVRSPWAVDLTQHRFTGLRIREYVEGGRSLQLPSWSLGGHLVSYAIDGDGNIYLTPAPYVSLMDNPPKEQNRVYRVNSESGEMETYINLPGWELLNENNPFGSFGVAYDCETKSLYVSSLAGSTYKEERGTIFQINVSSGEIMNKYQGIDALALSVCNTPKGKRLFFGSARQAEIRSLGLDKNGDFKGDLYRECSMIHQKGGGMDKAVRIRFPEPKIMEVKAMEFSYSLIASSDPLRNVYIFKMDEEGKWQFHEMYKQ